jgi:hypothetical protein
MGMFDTIHSEVQLPLSRKTKAVLDPEWYKKEDFQTKSLDCTLTNYKIGKTGQLYYEKVEGENVRIMTEAEEKKARKKKNWVWPYEFKEISRAWIKVKHTGVINFYGSPYDMEGNEWWIEYDAKFVDGKLTGKPKVVKEEIFNTKEEIEEHRLDIEATMTAHINHPWTKTKRALDKYTFGGYYKFVRLVGKFFGSLSKWSSKVQMFIYRHF